jgi:hypothetical protein
MSSDLEGPVGKRWKVTNVRNKSTDQDLVIDLLRAIPDDDGGKKTSWLTRPLSLPDGQCPQWLADAIWDFQVLWKKRQVFHNIDGVVDPHMHTLQKMYQLALIAPPDKPKPGEPPAPHGQSLIQPVRKPGIWQITNVWSLNVGEVGMLGGIKIEITQPDETKFVLGGAGAGFGPSLDPGQILKGLKGLKMADDAMAVTVANLSKLLAKNIGWNVGDVLGLLGIPSQTADNMFRTYTSGRIYPVGGMFKQPPALSKYALARGGNTVFGVLSGGAGAGYGSELGMIYFNLDATRVASLGSCCTAVGFYGSAGATLKVGAAAQIMLFNSWLE